MKNIWIRLWILLIVLTNLLTLLGLSADRKSASSDSIMHDTVVINNTLAQDQPMNFFIGVIVGEPGKTAEVEEMAEIFKKCCCWSGCLKPDIHYLQEVPHKKSDIQQLFKNLYDCAVFLCFDPKEKMIEWRLYDTAFGRMLKGRKQSFSGESSDMHMLVYRMAGSVLGELMNEPQPFLSKIAYRKRDFKKQICELVVTHFDGSSPRTILSSSRILVAPHWNSDREFPILFFSEFTPKNVCLKMVDLYGRSLIILNVEGTTAGVSCTPLSSDVVYCHSGDIWKYHYDPLLKKSFHTRLIHEQDICASPVLLENGDIFYAYKGTIKKYNAAKAITETIINNGYCVSPAYCPVVHKLAYAKKVQGNMQIFVYDIATGQHEQITFESKNNKSDDYRSNKTDVCWSPDGRYLLFAWERKDKSKIGLLNLKTKKYTFITPEGSHCSYPAWSGIYG